MTELFKVGLLGLGETQGSILGFSREEVKISHERGGIIRV